MIRRSAIRLAKATALASTIVGLAGSSSANNLPASSKSPAQVLAAADAANPEWRKAARALTPAWVLGRLYRVDDAAGKSVLCRLPERRRYAVDTGSAFDFGQVVEVGLE